MNFIENFIEESNQQRILLNKLANSTITNYIFGAGVFAYVLVQFLNRNGIKIDGAIIDSAYLSQPTFTDLNVITLEDVQSTQIECNIFIGVTNYPAIKEKLTSLGFKNIHLIDIPDYLNMPHRFIDRNYLENHVRQFEQAHSVFEDQHSKNTFIASLNTKLSEDLTHIEAHVCLDHIYFPSTEFRIDDNADFLDVGGFTGDTIREFHQMKGGKYHRIVSLEPSEDNFTQLQNTAKELNKNNIFCYKVGAWHEKATLNFATKDGDIDNSISDIGEHTIQADTIDNIMKSLGGEISLLKLDINGAEYNALLGATKTIQENRPLIITRLHRKEDYYRIPLLLKKISPEIKIYLRQRNYMSMMVILYADFGSKV
jgi:FkbM family methyltransferase